MRRRSRLPQLDRAIGPLDVANEHGVASYAMSIGGDSCGFTIVPAAGQVEAEAGLPSRNRADGVRKRTGRATTLRASGRGVLKDGTAGLAPQLLRPARGLPFPVPPFIPSMIERSDRMVSFGSGSQ